MECVNAANKNCLNALRQHRKLYRHKNGGGKRIEQIVVMD